MLPECYSEAHRSDLAKVGARVPAAREFILSFNPALGTAENAQAAFSDRWYGNASADVCTKLTGHFNFLFNRFPGQLALLSRFIRSAESASFPVVNHFYLVLADPYYRWTASDYLPVRVDTLRQEIAVTPLEHELRSRLPASFTTATVNRYARNLLTSLRDNGFLTGKAKKAIASPAISVRCLAYMLYALSDCGVGANEFDGSPVHRSLLKPRELLAPLYQEGERLSYWDSTGDRKRLGARLRFSGLAAWMEAAGL